MAIYRGMLVESFGGMVITTDKLPDWLIDLPRLTLFDIGGLEIRAMVALAFVVVIVFHLATSYLNFGRQFYALGSNPEAAELIGLPKERIVFTAFVLVGSALGPRRLHVPRAVWEHHCSGGEWPGTPVGRGGGGRRRQHLRRLGNGTRRHARRRHHRHARSEPGAAPDQRVLAGCGARSADPARGRRRCGHPRPPPQALGPHGAEADRENHRRNCRRDRKRRQA